MLERQGYKILNAKDGREGVDIFRLFQQDILAVLLDCSMPMWSGDEVFRELWKIHEDVRVILSSVYNEQETPDRFVGTGLVAFIPQPYRLRDLIELLQQVLAIDSIHKPRTGPEEPRAL